MMCASERPEGAGHHPSDPGYPAPASPDGPRRLSELRESETARVIRVGGEGPLRRRILEMGIVKGAEVYVEKYAPLRDPMELIVKGYHVSLRVAEARRITVERVR